MPGSDWTYGEFDWGSSGRLVEDKGRSCIGQYPPIPIWEYVCGKGFTVNHEISGGHTRKCPFRGKNKPGQDNVPPVYMGRA